MAKKSSNVVDVEQAQRLAVILPLYAAFVNPLVMVDVLKKKGLNASPSLVLADIQFIKDKCLNELSFDFQQEFDRHLQLYNEIISILFFEIKDDKNIILLEENIETNAGKNLMTSKKIKQAFNTNRLKKIGYLLQTLRERAELLGLMEKDSSKFNDEINQKIRQILEIHE